MLRERVIEDISPNDVMYNESPDLPGYLENGRSGFMCIRRGRVAARATRVTSVLDFACGHGRVARHLRAAWPKARFTVSDIDPDGVEFCAQTFGARGVISDEDPRRIELGDSFDVIWVGSLFTHLDVPRWRKFIRLLEDALSPGGVLVFSTHGRRAVEILRPHLDAPELFDSYDRTGFGWVVDLPKYHNPEFGCSLSDPEWVCGFLAGFTGLEVADVNEAGWGQNHDVITARAPASAG